MRPAPMRYLFICNPAAARGRAARLARALPARLARAGMDAEVVATSHAGHATTLVHARAAAFDAVVAVGGDGTVSEIGRGLIESESSVPLAVLPSGSGNDFARMLGMPRRLDAALAALQAARTHAVDHGLLHWTEGGTRYQRPFVNAAGIGFDALVAHETAEKKQLPGLLGYGVAMVGAAAAWAGAEVRVEGDGALVYEGNMLLATAGNGASSGGGFRLTPRASISDGRLDVCVIEHAGWRQVLRGVPDVLQGRHIHRPDVHMARVRTLTLRSASGLPVHADGEVAARAARDLRIDAVAGGLRLLAPRVT